MIDNKNKKTWFMIYTHYKYLSYRKKHRLKRDLKKSFQTWFAFTIIITLLPLFLKCFVLGITLATFSITDILAEILLISLMLSFDSYKVMQLLRKEETVITRVAFESFLVTILSACTYMIVLMAIYGTIPLSRLNIPLSIVCSVLQLCIALVLNINAQIINVAYGDYVEPGEE